MQITIDPAVWNPGLLCTSQMTLKVELMTVIIIHAILNDPPIRSRLSAAQQNFMHMLLHGESQQTYANID